MLEIRLFAQTDWPALWRVLEPVLRAGETYAFSPEIAADAAHAAWIDAPEAAFVAFDEAGTLVGTYLIKPNQPCLGAHVCNCAYVVAEHARGRGVASAMCQHSQDEAVARGYRAMQYNLVVSTNTSAIKVWQRHGFHIAGTLPQAFRHPRHGLVDAYIMYKLLVT